MSNPLVEKLIEEARELRRDVVANGVDGIQQLEQKYRLIGELVVIEAELDRSKVSVAASDGRSKRYVEAVWTPFMPQPRTPGDEFYTPAPYTDNAHDAIVRLALATEKDNAWVDFSDGSHIVGYMGEIAHEIHFAPSIGVSVKARPVKWGYFDESIPVSEQPPVVGYARPVPMPTTIP